MKLWLKVVLGILAVSLVSCGLLVGGAMYWFDKNKGALKETGQKVMADAKAFAATHDADACVVEALRRMDADSSFMAKVETKIFLEHCVEAAPKSATFCAGVPAEGEILETAKWSVSKCADLGHAGNQDCARLIQGLQRGCMPKAPEPPHPG